MSRPLAQVGETLLRTAGTITELAIWCQFYRARTGLLVALPPSRPSQAARPRRSGGCYSPPVPGRGCNRAEVRTLLRRLGRAADLPADLAGSLSPHSMRHAFATLNLDAGASLRDLQDAMGHASPRTTRRYDRGHGNLDRSPGYLLAGYFSRAR